MTPDFDLEEARARLKAYASRLRKEDFEPWDGPEVSGSMPSRRRPSVKQIKVPKEGQVK